MEFVDTRKNDQAKEVKFEIPQSSKCKTIIKKNVMWQGKIKKRKLRSPLLGHIQLHARC